MHDLWYWPVTALHALPPEIAHRLGVMALATNRLPFAPVAAPILAQSLWGMDFANPLGMAAGFDKNAECGAGLLAMGLGFAELGTVTPRPQAGNARPRLFRCRERGALINRLGFNNHGLEKFVANFTRQQRAKRTGWLAANVGANRDSPDRVADYVAGIRATASVADIQVINISSPNTPGLRGLQEVPALTALLTAVQAARAQQAKAPPLWVKIAPDLDDQALAALVPVLREQGVEGLVIGNTTLARPPDLPPIFAAQAGGLSGPYLRARCLAMVRQAFRLAERRLVVVACGGISSGADAYAAIRAGASLIQLYTAFVYQGPGVVGQVLRGLAARLQTDGFACLSDAIGVDA